MKKLWFSLSLTLLSLLAPTYALADAAYVTFDTRIDATTDAPVTRLDEKLVLGRLENVTLSVKDEQGQAALEGVPFAGKIDTGADTTSMHAIDIHVSSQHPDYAQWQDEDLMRALVKDVEQVRDINYSDWNRAVFAPYQVSVRFSIIHPYSGERVTLALPLERVGVIRSRSSAEPILRPTVNVPLTIAGTTVETDVNLTDRSQFSAPILIGKTFLKDHAWVFAGADHLQTWHSAQLIGRKETVEIDGVAQRVSYSLNASYSALDASDIDVSDDGMHVRFTIEGPQGERKTLTRPVIRELKVSGKSRPMVYVPVTFGEQKSQQWLVYLTDRHHKSSDIRLGKQTLSEHFVIDPSATDLLAGKAQTLSSRQAQAALQITGQETLLLDGIALPAEASWTVGTPLLKVASFETYQQKGKEWVTYYLNDNKSGLNDNKGEAKQFSKPIHKKLKVGETTRPVVFGSFMLKGQEVELPYAIEVLGDKEPREHFIIGRNMTEGGVLINTRSEELLSRYPLFKAGHIEVAQVEGLTFPVKLDTGADVSSLNAQNIERFERDGQAMVRFDYENDQGDKKTFTLPVVHEMSVRAKKGEKANVRPVVEMRVKLGELEKKIRVNLQDRDRFHYSMILGKNFLKYGVLVSSDDDYLVTKKPSGE